MINNPNNIAPNNSSIEEKALAAADPLAQLALANAGNQTKKAAATIQTVAQTAQQASGYVKSGQQAADAVMQKMVATNNAPAPAAESSSSNNAAAIAASAVEGVIHLVSIKIIVEGGTEIVHYKSFNLSQTATNHHSFNLILPHDALGTPQTQSLEDAQKLLGKRITITFSYKNIISGPERSFIGVITQLGFSQDFGSLGDIVVTGQSPTALLDGAPHIQSFGGGAATNLSSVVNSILKEGLGESKFDVKVAPEYVGGINYCCQYDETHYNFLARTAEAYGEQFFYDGTTIYFGKLPAAEKPLELTYGHDTTEIQVQMNARHVSPIYYGYNSSKHEPLSTGTTKVEPKGSLAKQAYTISESVYKTPSLRIAPIKAVTNKDIEASQKGASGSAATSVFTTTGRTSIPFLYPGCELKLNFRKRDIIGTEYFTKLKVISINHFVDALGHYSGSFEAIDADSGYIPSPAFYIPKAEPQIATVTDNKDNQGRVKVHFDWQLDGGTSEFIRVMSPDAGSSDKVGKNRGLVTIPEIGDQVMIGFVHNHADRPFVMGGLFHGKVGGGGGAGNNIKSLTSKSGHTIQLDDGGGITVMDKTGGNIIVVDGKDTISGVASQKISLSNGKSSIVMDGDTITINAATINVVGSTIVDIGSGAAGFTATSNGGKAAVNGTETSVTGTSTTKVTGPKTNVSGDNVTINGSADTAITGGLVKINS